MMIKVSINGSGGVHEYCFIICFVITIGKYEVLLFRLDKKNSMNTHQVCLYVLTDK